MFKKIADLFGGNLLESVSGVVDKFVTTKGEKMHLNLELQKLLNEKAVQAQQIIMEGERELTKRHAADMSSDSWLSKNIRPLILLFLTVGLVVLAYLSIFALSVEEVALVQPWINLLGGITGTAYSFYFGSRGWEKITQLKQKQITPPG